MADDVWAVNGCLARWQNGTWTTYDIVAFIHRIHAVRSSKSGPVTATS
ncbi:hypothetical protein [Actinomadura bangladeshensis]|nr:hypothetical protein [Actinomadura bangladeshensis]